MSRQPLLFHIGHSMPSNKRVERARLTVDLLASAATPPLTRNVRRT